MINLANHEPMSSTELLFTLATNSCTLRNPMNIKSKPSDYDVNCRNSLRFLRRPEPHAD